MGDKSPKSKAKVQKQKDSDHARVAQKAQAEKDAKALNGARFKK